MPDVNESDLRRAARKVAPEEIAATILRLLGERGAGKTLGPTDVARVLGGDHPGGWGPLMPAIRREAVRLMQEGRLVVVRKGRPVDPEDFRGIYRFRLPDAGEASGEGSSASERPDSQ